VTIVYAWRAALGNSELDALHASAFGPERMNVDWESRLERHSLGWVSARDGDELVGFVNVAWDGGSHAFILDTIVAPRARHEGVGTHLVALAIAQARAARCEWLHVDFEADLAPFYLDGCGFQPTPAGLIRL